MIMVNILVLAQVKVTIMKLICFLLAALNIDVLSIIIMELILHNRHRHITLMMDPLASYLSPTDQINIRAIILMKTIYLISLLITGMITMMILCLIANSMWK